MATLKTPTRGGATALTQGLKMSAGGLIISSSRRG